MTDEEMVNNYYRTHKVVRKDKFQSFTSKLMTQDEYAAYLSDLKKRLKDAAYKKLSNEPSNTNRYNSSYSRVSNALVSIDETMFNYGE